MTKNRSPRPYLQFPLCAFSYPEPDRRDCIIWFCCVEHGRRQWSKLAKADSATLLRNGVDDLLACQLRSPKLAIWACARFGALLLRVNESDAQSIVRGHARLADYIEKFQNRHGRDPLVRVAADFIYGGDSRLSDRELAVLCAIYSKIGASNGPVRITRDDVWRRAHGFKSKRVFEAEMVGELFVTVREVRSIIDSLQARRFFARTTFARRQTYYSHRLTTQELNNAIIELKRRGSIARMERINDDQDLTARVRDERRKLAQSRAPDLPLK